MFSFHELYGVSRRVICEHDRPLQSTTTPSSPMVTLQSKTESSLWSLMPSLLSATDVGSVLVASGSNLRHGFPTHYGVPLLHLKTVFCDHVLGWAPSSKTSRRMAWRRPWSTIKTRNWCWRLVRRWVACHRNSPPSCRRLRTLNVFSSWNIHDLS